MIGVCHTLLPIGGIALRTENQLRKLRRLLKKRLVGAIKIGADTKRIQGNITAYVTLCWMLGISRESRQLRSALADEWDAAYAAVRIKQDHLQGKNHE
jgi:hypothetical protein